jgi:WD40 repeat protein
MLASGTNANGGIKLWEFPGGQEILTLPGHNTTILSLAFNPDGTLLASSGEDKRIKLWDVESGHEIRTLSGHSRHVRRVEFSPDGQWLASASTDGTIKFWNIQEECNFQLDDLLSQGCRRLQAYLQHNPNVRDEDRGICDEISGKLKNR